MGRFEKRPDNDPRVRGELSRAAETALWAVVEDLESLQQNVLRSFQEEIKKLQTEKDRLTDEVQQLIEEKEHLQEVRRITEQQVLIRQLSEALAKHICSQLQSSLAKIANQTESQIAALKSAQSIGPAIENNEQVEKMLGSLDDNLTIAFNSLQQELKNYQSNLSQQLSRMYNQQQQGETIVEELIDRLRGELTRAIQETSTATPQLSPPTVLQPPELQSPSSPVVVNLSPPTVLQFPDQPSPNPLQASTPVEETSTTKPSVSITPPEKSIPVPIVPPPQETRPEPQSVIPKVSPDSETKLQSVQEKAAEPSSVINRELSAGAAKSPPTPEKPPEPISTSKTKFSPSSEKPPEPISTSKTKFSPSSEKPPEPISTSKTKFSPSSEKPPEPVSVLSRDSSASKASTPPPASVVRRGSTPSSSRSRKSSNLSPVQVGFLLVVLSTVMTALYNVVLKGMFYKTSQLSAMLEVAGLISPTLGNIMLILTLRLMVVVPLMILLAPMMYPQVWQDLQNLKQSLGNNQPGSRSQPQRVVQLMFASGCFLFLSQVLIYLAIGQVSTGVAIALFFVYPLINGVLSWLLFRDRPGVFRASAIGSIFCGEVLVFAGATSTGIGTSPLGSITAILAGTAFACYLILTRVCAAKVHPVSLSLINFITMLGLSFIFLMIPLPENWSLVVDPSKLLEIVLSAFILGALTLLSYVFSHIGINKLGGLRSAIISASVPILTVIFAGLILQETLNIAQIFGVLFVTFGAIAFGVGKIQNPNKPANVEG
ncbi:septal junction formation protein SepJ [Nostoc parmelioides]|uniref:Septal junction formation protein SepJ n=1 Tax=Nostoc parmelioides FACHB-3921 TaxID=2692909 RepID=A0ABR8BA68_9NOSO|nr:septal junction formation protein SepJ [Nostoc parmelioides]MBD2249790.1 septal junction formation protein SepJ [Nostoc parmelioides FACHB-3921]